MTDKALYACIEADEQDRATDLPANIFMAEFENIAKRLSSDLWVLHRVYVKLRAVNGEIEIVSLNSVRRGGGFGNWCLSTICEIADRTDTRLVLTVNPFDDPPMQADTLRAWYGRNRFKQVDGTERMLRLPCGRIA